MKLYSYWRSSCSWRARLALELKGMPYEIVPVHLVRDGGEQHAEAFGEVSSLRQVPVLELQVEGKPLRVAQSMAIMELLEELKPEPALWPESVAARARARQLAEIVNAGTQPLQNLYVLNELKRRAPDIDRKGWATHFIQRGLAAAEQVARETSGQYLVGDRVSIADLCLVPQLYNARRFGLSLDEFPTLGRVEKACEKLAEFQRAHPDAQPDREK